MAVILGPDGGPPIPIKIEPQDFHNAAQQFVQASTTLYQILPTLFRVLDGFRGPAGVDDSAKQLDAAYRPAVQSIITGVNRAVNLLGDIGLGIDTSARNHWNADAAATPSGGQPPPWTPVDTGLVLPQSLSVPSLVGSPTAVLPPPLSDKVPMGHIDDLHTVAQAFRTARDTIDDTSTSLHNTLEYLFSHNQSADLDALNQFWDHVGGNADTAILTALQRGCDQIASAVDDYANWTVDTQNQILDAIGEFLKNAALGAIVALLLGLITDGLGALAAILKAADDVGEGGVLIATISGAIALADTRLVAIGAAASGVVGAMTTAINATPNPNIDPTDPQSVTDTQEQADAEHLGDQAAKIQGLTPEQYEQAVTQLQADSPASFPITRAAADTMLDGPAGTTPEVAGPGTPGADITFRDADGNVVLKREVKTLDGNANSFSRQLSRIKDKQLPSGGEAWFGVRSGTTSDDVYNLMRQFQQNRLGNAGGLGKYDGLTVTFVDENGNIVGSFDPTSVLPPK